MKQVRIIRVETNPDHGTFGVMVVNGAAFCVTLEPYTRNNANTISNIPPGQYLCEACNSPKWGHTYTVNDVQGRDYIRFHPGNTEDDTEGCILVGQYFGKLKERRAILNSGNTHLAFMRMMNDEPFILTISTAY